MASLVVAPVLPAAGGSGPRLVQARCGGPCQDLLQVDVSAAGTAGAVEFLCPRCNTRNRINVESQASTGPAPDLPSWWRSKPKLGDSVLVGVANDEIRDMQKLFDRTWKDITTRDRGFTKPPRLQVVQVQQNCNPALWKNYAAARDEISAKMAGQGGAPCGTSRAMQEDGTSFGPLVSGANEFLLFHGTKPSACENICKSDFLVSLSGSNVGTLYGKGIYFSENSSKSDEYASDDASGIFSGLYALLVCRVTLGRMLYTEEVTPDTEELLRNVRAGGFNSVLGDREKARGTYREFVVYESRQVYPEFVVIYRRETRE